MHVPQAFLAAALERRANDGLEVFEHSRRHLLAAMEEIGFDDFSGKGYQVMNRLARRLHEHGRESALWGLVALDLWFCNNFGGSHWRALVERDQENVRFAIQAAYWVFIASSANGAFTLAMLINQSRCWDDAEQWVRSPAAKPVTDWWARDVLPYKKR
jgi:hypothetical protein